MLPAYVLATQNHSSCYAPSLYHRDQKPGYLTHFPESFIRFASQGDAEDLIQLPGQWKAEVWASAGKIFLQQPLGISLKVTCFDDTCSAENCWWFPVGYRISRLSERLWSNEQLESLPLNFIPLVFPCGLVINSNIKSLHCLKSVEQHIFFDQSPTNTM